MKEILVPERYNYIGIFLTLRCNLKCSYCLNGKLLNRERKELSAEQWIKILNRLNIKRDLPITLEGGEPSLHYGFYDIIDGTNHFVDILSNLRFDPIEFIDRVNITKLNEGRNLSYKPIRISYHNQDMNELINKANVLQNFGFNVGVFSINLPEKTESNMIMAEKCRQAKIYFFVKDFLGFRDGRLFGHYKYPKAVSREGREYVQCRIKELLVAPDGQVFKCHRNLYLNENSIGNLLDEDFEIKDIFRTCDDCGFCSPCDVKLKTNRFLKMGSCSVEIKEN